MKIDNITTTLLGIFVFFLITFYRSVFYKYTNRKTLTNDCNQVGLTCPQEVGE